MGFDVVHFNLHKTFSTPMVVGTRFRSRGVKMFRTFCLNRIIYDREKQMYRLEDNRPQSIGRVKAFYGNFTVRELLLIS